MKVLSAHSRAMILFKAACDGGARRQALALLRNVAVNRGGEAMVNWPLALTELEDLLKSLSTELHAAAPLAIELIEEDDEDEDYVLTAQRA